MTPHLRMSRWSTNFAIGHSSPFEISFRLIREVVFTPEEALIVFTSLLVEVERLVIVLNDTYLGVGAQVKRVNL